MERAAEASGAALAAASRTAAALVARRKLAPLPPSPLPDKLYAIIDGTSVPVEAGCQAVGQQSGMHWTVNGADSIITLRCAEASSQWEAICRNRHNQTGAPDRHPAEHDLQHLQN